jgi:hypothetical protein
VITLNSNEKVDVKRFKRRAQGTSSGDSSGGTFGVTVSKKKY